VRRRAAAHTAVAGEAEAAAAEKAAAEKAAAEKAAAEKAAAEKAAAAGKAAGARLCSKCHQPTKGHPRPFGEQCAATVLPTPEKGRGPSMAAEKIVTPVKEDLRVEDCPCCGAPLTSTHQCPDSDAPEEEDAVEAEPDECIDFTCDNEHSEGKTCFHQTQTSWGRCWCDEDCTSCCNVCVCKTCIKGDPITLFGKNLRSRKPLPFGKK
jgi:hypothetical protein